MFHHSACVALVKCQFRRRHFFKEVITLAEFKKGERCEIAAIIESNCENKLLIFKQIKRDFVMLSVRKGRTGKI